MKKLFVLILSVLACTNAFAKASGDGRKTVASAGTAERISATSQPFVYASFCAELDNTGVIAIGPSPVASLATWAIYTT